MAWYTLIILFFAGAFFANSIPHYVSGVLGRKFPTPFSDPPGKGLSSPLVNVLWGLSNFIIASLLFMLARSVQFGLNFESLVLLLGVSFVSYISAKNFGKDL